MSSHLCLPNLVQTIATACLHLAAKMEECPKPIREVVSLFHFLPIAVSASALGSTRTLVSWFASIEKLCCCLWSQLIQWLTQASWVSLDMYQMPVSQSSCLTPAASKNLGQAGLGSDQARAERVEKCNRCTCTVAMPAHKGTA